MAREATGETEDDGKENQRHRGGVPKARLPEKGEEYVDAHRVCSAPDGGVTQDVYDGFPPAAKAQSNFEHAHVWEQGGYAVLPYIAGQVASPERMRAGLLIARDYMHANGITIGNEPGGIRIFP